MILERTGVLKYTNDYIKFLWIVVFAKLLNEASINSVMKIYSYIKQTRPIQRLMITQNRYDIIGIVYGLQNLIVIFHSFLN